MEDAAAKGLIAGQRLQRLTLTLTLAGALMLRRTRSKDTMTSLVTCTDLGVGVWGLGSIVGVWVLTDLVLAVAVLIEGDLLCNVAAAAA